MNKSSEEDHGDDLSSQGDASPLFDGESLQSRRAHRCRARFQKFGCIAFTAIYVLVYRSLSSNPEIFFANSGYHNGQVIAAGAPSIIGTKEHQRPSWDQQLHQTALTIARVYNPVPPSSWCIDGSLKFEQGKGRPMGLCYLKIPRAASSTLVGVNVRISRNFAARNGLEETCIRHDGPAPGFRYRQREPLFSYLWTFVRDPAERAMSRVASNLAKRQIAPSPTNSAENYTMDALKTSTDIQFGAISEGRGGFQVQYTMLTVIKENMFWNASQPSKVRKSQHLRQLVKGILQNYDFIGTVERFDESLVAMQLLLGLETSDMLYFSSRLPEHYTLTQMQGDVNNVCQKNIDPQILRTAGVNGYLSGAEWGAQNYGDLLLHRAASLSLDKTISEIGLNAFSAALKSFRSMMQMAQQTCHPKFPCSENGTDQSERAVDDCFFNDIGCGFKCLDSLHNGTG